LETNQQVGLENAAAMLVDSRSMEVLAQVGSADFFSETISGQIDGTRSRRSPGSTLKPFIYALAMDQGLIHPLTMLTDAPRRFGAYSPENFDGDFDQRHTLNVFARQRLSYRLAVSAKLRVGSNFPIVEYFSGTNPEVLLVSSERNAVRLPRYTRLDLRANYAFIFDKHRLTLFVEMMNATGRENLGQADGFIVGQPGGIFVAQRYAERLIPRVPSAGFLIEF
jgi:hypothetical protein